MNVVIDSDIFIDSLRGVKAANSFIKKQQDLGNEIFFSAITELELVAGKDCKDAVKKDFSRVKGLKLKVPY